MNDAVNYREVTRNVMEWFVEHEDGLIRLGAEQPVFHPGVIDHRLDVEKALKRLSPKDRKVLLAVHVYGFSHREAVEQAGYKSLRPDAVVAAIEAKAGHIFKEMGLDDIEGYVR